MIEAALEEGRADALPSAFGADPDLDHLPPGKAAPAHEATAHRPTVVLGQEVQPLRLAGHPLPHELGGDRVAEADGTPHLRVGGEVFAGSGLADHPDRFSFPCRLA